MPHRGCFIYNEQLKTGEIGFYFRHFKLTFWGVLKTTPTPIDMLEKRKIEACICSQGKFKSMEVPPLRLALTIWLKTQMTPVPISIILGGYSFLKTLLAVKAAGGSKLSC